MQKSNENVNQHQQKGYRNWRSRSSSGDEEVQHNTAIESPSPNKGDNIEQEQNNENKKNTPSLFSTSESTDAAVARRKKPRKTEEERKEAKRAANRRSAYKCRIRSKGIIEQLRSQISDAYKRTEKMRKDKERLSGILSDIERENGTLSRQLELRKVPEEHVAKMPSPPAAESTVASPGNAGGVIPTTTATNLVQYYQQHQWPSSWGRGEQHEHILQNLLQQQQQGRPMQELLMQQQQLQNQQQQHQQLQLQQHQQLQLQQQLQIQQQLQALFSADMPHGNSSIDISFA